MMFNAAGAHRRPARPIVQTWGKTINGTHKRSSPTAVPPTSARPSVVRRPHNPRTIRARGVAGPLAFWVNCEVAILAPAALEIRPRRPRLPVPPDAVKVVQSFPTANSRRLPDRRIPRNAEHGKPCHARTFPAAIAPTMNNSNRRTAARPRRSRQCRSAPLLPQIQPRAVAPLSARAWARKAGPSTPRIWLRSWERTARACPTSCGAA